jgi:5-methylcytosine-specific restriction endonuclease McrA
MIQLPIITPSSKKVLDSLATYQAAIDGLPSFDEQSAEAKADFPRKNKQTNNTFKAVKDSLTDMCSGARRCVYCEDSAGSQVEHIYPKSLYPEKTYDWENYVYACSDCNGPKNNKFAVFRADNGAFQTVNPPKNQPAVKPPTGEVVLINPRVENPLDYCILDISNTFKFVFSHLAGSKEHTRATYTFDEVLRLNHEEREHLRIARREAYGDYKARLREYVHHRDMGSTQYQLDQMIEQLKRKGHPTVWKEMQRYYNRGLLHRFDQHLHDLFTEAPEALIW